MAQRNEQTEIMVVEGKGPARNTEVRERFWQAVERIRALNTTTDPDVVLRDVTETVEEVRQEQFQRERRAQGGYWHQAFC